MMENPNFFMLHLLDGSPAVARRGNPAQVVAVFPRGDDGAQLAEEFASAQNGGIPPAVAFEIERDCAIAARVQDTAHAILQSAGLLKPAKPEGGAA